MKPLPLTILNLFHFSSLLHAQLVDTSTTWKLVSIRDEVTGISDTTAANEKGLTIEFLTDSTCTGRTSSNTYWGRYVILTDSVSISVVGMTEAMEHSGLGVAFPNYISGSKKYTLTNDSLILTDSRRTLFFEAYRYLINRR